MLGQRRRYVSAAATVTEQSSLESPLLTPSEEEARKGKYWLSLTYTQQDDHVQLAHSTCCQKHRTKTLKLATWNIHFLLDNAASDRPERRTAIIERELARYDIDIAALSETRRSGEGQLREGGGYTF